MLVESSSLLSVHTPFFQTKEMIMIKRAALLILCIAAQCASAQVAVGTVKTIRGHDSTLWGPDSNFITVDGFTSAGSCATQDGLVTMTIRGYKLGDRQTAIALLAKTTGKMVRVSVDPTFAGPGASCYLRWIELAE